MKLTMGSADLTLYARWVPVTAIIHTVTFESNGGSPVAEQNVVDGETATEPVPPTRTGYTFDGWNGGGSPYVFSTAVTENTTLEAVWTANDYDLTFNSNDSTGTTSATGMPSAISVTFGETEDITD